jgi:hypothetical protein
MLWCVPRYGIAGGRGKSGVGGICGYEVWVLVWYGVMGWMGKDEVWYACIFTLIGHVLLDGGFGGWECVVWDGDGG